MITKIAESVDIANAFKSDGREKPVKIQHLDTNMSWPTEVVWAGAQKGPVVLLLHGYLQTAEKITSLLQSAFSDDFQILAVSAPFPVMRRRDERFEMGYSWFFFNPQTQEYLIRREFALEFVLGVVNELGLLAQIKKVVGYSQGGYLAPFIAQELPEVSQIVGLSCRFRHEDFVNGPSVSFRWDQVHGLQDQVVDPVTAKESHIKLVQAGFKGEFAGLDGIGHEINEQVLLQTRRLIQIDSEEFEK